MTSIVGWRRFYGLWKQYKYLIVIVVAGLIVLMIPSAGNKEKNDEIIKEEEVFNLVEFEKRIEDVLSNGAGVGRVKVVITIKSGMEHVYAEEMKSNTREQQENGDIIDVDVDSDRKPSILSKSNGGEEPVIIKKIYPEFLGAAVVCDGADNPEVELYIIDVISSLTGISSDRVTVIKMKK